MAEKALTFTNLSKLAPGMRVKRKITTSCNPDYPKGEVTLLTFIRYIEDESGCYLVFQQPEINNNGVLGEIDKDLTQILINSSNSLLSLDIDLTDEEMETIDKYYLEETIVFQFPPDNRTMTDGRDELTYKYTLDA